MLLCLVLLLFPAPCLGLLDLALLPPRLAQEERRGGKRGPLLLDAAEALAQLMPSEGLYPQPRGGPGAANLRPTIAHL